MSTRESRKAMFKAINGAIKFVKNYKFDDIPAADIEIYPYGADMDKKILGTCIEPETTKELSKRTECRHPSYAVHLVSWRKFMQTEFRSKIEQTVLEKTKDAFILSNVLSKAECAALIHLSERHEYHTLISAENGNKGRTNTRILTHDETLSTMLFERMKPFLPKTYEMSDGRMWNEKYDLCGLNERFRWCKYVKGQSFKNIHCDKRVSLPKEDRFSFFTVNIYLNAHDADYSGGRTIFYDQKGFDGKRPRYEESSAFGAQTGDVMVFNHYPQKYPHCGETLESGTKYLLRSDVMYKRRRSG